MQMRRRSHSSCDKGTCSRRHLLVGGMMVLVLAVVAAACLWRSRSGNPTPPDPLLPQPTGAVATPKGIELFAEAHANAVMVTVINHMDKDLLVGPKMFAVIAGGKLYPVDPKDVVARFPIRSLHREEGVSGTFQFRNLATLEGARLVFNSPGNERQFVLINRYESRTPNYQPELPQLSPKEQRKLQREQEQVRKALMEALQKQQAQSPK